MIGKAKSIGHTGNAIEYAKEKLEAKELGRHDVIGDTSKEIANDFRAYQDMNYRCQNKTISMVISPEPKDGKRLTDKELHAITKDFLKEMNLDKNQWIAYVHNDREHRHVHVFANRIGQDGKAYDDSYISNRASRTADLIAERQGLTQAKEIQLAKSKSFQQEKQLFNDLSDKVIHHDKSRSIDDYIEKFNRRGKEHGLSVQKYINKQGNFQGLQYFKGDQKFKASEIGRHLSAKNMLKIATMPTKLLNPQGMIIQQLGKIVQRGLGHDKGGISL